ncbi:unnamed protein product [Citrullus colocynthis]|uniref:Uncharacterized protein n=1 Tax=Citrullus colocynthis TaxID=252529 RepID=A0ABP0XU65_9ROSI
MHENTHGKEAEESDTSDRSAALVNFVNNNCGNVEEDALFEARIFYIEGEEECDDNGRMLTLMRRLLEVNPHTWSLWKNEIQELRLLAYVNNKEKTLDAYVVVCLFLDVKMDSELEHEEQASSAILQINRMGNTA